MVEVVEASIASCEPYRQTCSKVLAWRESFQYAFEDHLRRGQHLSCVVRAYQPNAILDAIHRIGWNGSQIREYSEVVRDLGLRILAQSLPIPGGAL